METVTLFFAIIYLAKIVKSLFKASVEKGISVAKTN